MDIRNLKAVIFDKDGLLMDTEAPVFRVWQQVWAAAHLTLTEEIYRSFIGLGRKDNCETVRALFPGTDAEGLLSACAGAVGRYIETAPIRTMPGVFELLEVLDRRDVKKAVATSSGQKNARVTLSKCGLLGRMDAVISGEMVSRGKPFPDIFLLAAERLGAAPSECLVLEDSNAGVTAAHAAGIPVIVVPDLQENPPEILRLCERRCGSLLEVAALFQ